MQTPTQHISDTLLSGLEVWLPEGDELRQCCGFYSNDEALKLERQGYAFKKGEGEAGQAWASAAPVIGEPFEQAAAGNLCTVAIPCMRDGVCTGVATLLVKIAADGMGAVELWRVNDRGELALSKSLYSNLDRFGRISQLLKFPRRAGLPGKVWADRFPRVMGSLANSHDFVRAAGAKAEGLSTAVGLPVMRSSLELETVLVILSSIQSPIAKVMEVWAQSPEEDGLKVVSADYGPFVDLAPMSRRLRLQPGEGVAGRVFRDAAPWMTCDLLGVEFPRGERLGEYGFCWSLGLPVFVGADLVAVVSMLG